MNLSLQLECNSLWDEGMRKSVLLERECIVFNHAAFAYRFKNHCMYVTGNILRCGIRWFSFFRYTVEEKENVLLRKKECALRVKSRCIITLQILQKTIKCTLQIREKRLYVLFQIRRKKESILQMWRKRDCVPRYWRKRAHPSIMEEKRVYSSQM